MYLHLQHLSNTLYIECGNIFGQKEHWWSRTVRDFGSLAKTWLSIADPKTICLPISIENSFLWFPSMGQTDLSFMSNIYVK